MEYGSLYYSVYIIRFVLFRFSPSQSRLQPGGLHFSVYFADAFAGS